MTTWLSAVQRLRRERRPGVLVTITDVRGHAPRDAGAKMVVALAVVEQDAAAPVSTRAEEVASRPTRTTPPDPELEVWGTIGGGNLEATALDRARRMLDTLPEEPSSLTVPLNDKARTEHGRQCCGGEVRLLFEPLPVVPAVAIFGMGHVGLELARILCRHDLDLHLVDSRKAYLSAGRLACLEDGPAELVVHHSPVPELVLGEVPRGTHVLILTHDHAEDFALCDAALRTAHLGSIGLIGSTAKWRRFQQGLRVEGHPAETIARIQSPIGASDLTGKDPAMIALSVAAQLLRTVRVGVTS